MVITQDLLSKAIKKQLWQNNWQCRARLAAIARHGHLTATSFIACLCFQPFSANSFSRFPPFPAGSASGVCRPHAACRMLCVYRVEVPINFHLNCQANYQLFLKTMSRSNWAAAAAARFYFVQRCWDSPRQICKLSAICIANTSEWQIGGLADRQRCLVNWVNGS